MDSDAFRQVESLLRRCIVGGMPGTTRETLIKRYDGTRLYNTETASYVTLDDLARLRTVGRMFRVEEAATGKDITREVIACLKRAG